MPGASEGRLDEPRARAAAQLRTAAGAGESKIPQRIQEGRRRAEPPAESPPQPASSYTTAALNASGRRETGDCSGVAPTVGHAQALALRHRGVPRPLREVITASACPSMAARASGSCPASPVTGIPPNGSGISARRWCTPRGS